MEGTVHRHLKNGDEADRESVSVIIGESEPIRWLRRFIEKVAPLESNILIIGRSGSGKELVANVMHRQSRRASGPLVKISCAVSDEATLDLELFGTYTHGYHGDGSPRAGKFELARGGTVVLDEISDLPLRTQGKLLNIVDKRQIEIPGQTKDIPLDMRIIATTARSLPDLIGEGMFREDLYHRLNVIQIHVPALKDRIEDLPLLSSYLLKKINMKIGTHFVDISKEGLQTLMSYEWAGNVRELENVLERAALLGGGRILTEIDLQSAIRGSPCSATEVHDQRDLIIVENNPLKQTLKKVERDMIVRALVRANGVQAEAAKVLGLGSKNLWKKIQKHSIDVRSLNEGVKGSL